MNEMFYEKVKDNFDNELRKQRLNDFLKQIYEKNNIDKILTTRDDGLGFLTIPVVPIKFEEEIKNINDEIDKLKGKLLEIRSDKAKKN